MQQRGIDFIGDIHANYHKLKQLLEKLGYVYSNEKKIFTHPEGRLLCILGDFINVGLENLQVLSTLFAMHQQKLAHIIVGNHEYFLALLYYKTQNKASFWNYIQRNYYTIYQEFSNRKDQFYEFLDWINTLPLYVEFGKVKAIHAMWDDNNIKYFSNFNEVKKIIEQTSNNNELKEAVNKSLIGIIHKYRAPSTNFTLFFRYRWWDNNKNLPLQNMFIHKSATFPVEEIPNIDTNALHIQTDHHIIFFGHYNLQGYPYLTHPLRCCLDFGGAKGGFLAAYRYNGENVLKESNLVWV